MFINVHGTSLRSDFKTYLSRVRSPWPCIWAFLYCARDGGMTGTPVHSAAGLSGWCRPETNDPSGFPKPPELQWITNSNPLDCIVVTTLNKKNVFLKPPGQIEKTEGIKVQIFIRHVHFYHVKFCDNSGINEFVFFKHKKKSKFSDVNFGLNIFWILSDG